LRNSLEFFSEHLNSASFLRKVIIYQKYFQKVDGRIKLSGDFCIFLPEAFEDHLEPVPFPGEASAL
jgi:hypothetical protein